MSCAYCKNITVCVICGKGVTAAAFEPCRYADQCNEEGTCANGCDQRRYSDRVKCQSCLNGAGPNGCTDCLNTGYDPGYFSGGIDQALNDAYGEGRKDEQERCAKAKERE